MRHLIGLLFSLSVLLTQNAQAGTLDNQYREIAQQIDRSQYTRELQKIVGPRTSGSHKHLRVRDYLYNKLKGLGYLVELQNYGSGTNVIARKLGSLLPNEDIVISAHYDSINGGASTECDGADDNASGVAGVLEMARVLANKKFSRTLTIAFWDEEELGLLGSSAYVAQQASDVLKTQMMFDFEMIGYRNDKAHSQTMPEGFSQFFPKEYATIKQNQFRANFIGAIGDDSQMTLKANQYLQDMASSLELPTMTIGLLEWQRNSAMFRDFKRSDHASFWANKLPAIMFSDTANFRNPNYHCAGGRQDALETIDIDFASQVVKMTTYAAAKLLILDRE